MCSKSLIWNSLFAAAICLAAFLLYRILHRYSIHDISASLHYIPFSHLCLALACAAASYFCLTGFDFLAILSLGKSLPYRKVALASFISLSMGHNIGFAGLSSGAFRYRYYSRWGLTAQEVAKLVLFSGATVGLGLITLAGFTLLLNPQDAAGLLRWNSEWFRAAGGAIITLPITYVMLAAFLRRRFHLWRWTFELPDVSFAVLQVGMGALNFLLVSACLHQLLSAFADIAFSRSVTAFVLGNSAVLATHVPGGLGVLETAVAYVAPDAASIGALIAFRCIYFLLPLVLGTMLFIISEIVFRRHAGERKTTHEAIDEDPQRLSERPNRVEESSSEDRSLFFISRDNG